MIKYIGVPSEQQLDMLSNPNLQGVVAIYDPYRQYLAGQSGQIVHDYSGRNRSGVLGATDSVATDDPTWTSTSFVLDGVDDFINIPTSPLIPVSSLLEMTLCICFKRGQNGAFECLFSKNVLGVPNSYVLYFRNSNPYLRFNLNDGAEKVLNYTGDDLLTNKYYFLSMSIKNGEQKIYINGVLSAEASLSISAIDNTVINTNIGKENTTGGRYFFKGEIPLFIAYKRAISHQEHLGLYEYIKNKMLLRGISLT